MQTASCRYNYYITHGIDTDHIAPLDRSWVGRVLALLAPRLRHDKDDLIGCLVDEMRDDYLLGVKKAIVDFVLRDPRSDVQQLVNVGRQWRFHAVARAAAHPQIVARTPNFGRTLDTHTRTLWSIDPRKN